MFWQRTEIVIDSGTVIVASGFWTGGVGFAFGFLFGVFLWGLLVGLIRSFHMAYNEKLDVYRVTLELLGFCDALHPHWPRGKASLREQLGRAAESILQS